MTEEQVVNVRGEEISENGDDHRKIKANGVARENGGVGGEAAVDSSALDLVADGDAASEEEHKVNGESHVTVSEGEAEKTRKDAVSNGSAVDVTETTTVDVFLRDGESGQNGSGSVAASEVVADTVVQNGVVQSEIRNDDRDDGANAVAEELVTDHDDFVVVGAADVLNCVAVEDKIGGDANANGVKECQISAGDENGVVVTVVADENKSDREFEGVDVRDGVVVDRVEEEVTATAIDENCVKDVQGRSESISDKDVDKSVESENVASVADVSVEKDNVTNEKDDVEDCVEKNEVPVDVDAISATTNAKECASENAQNSLEKTQVEPVSDAGGGYQNGLAESEPGPSECAEENEIPIEGECGCKSERSEEESGSELVPGGETLSALNSTDMIGDGNSTSDIVVVSKGEPSVDVCEMLNNAGDSEADSSSNAVKSDGEPSVDVSEMKNNAVESEAEPLNTAVQCENKPSLMSEIKNDAVEREAEPSNTAVQSESKPSVVSEMKNDAVESETEPSNIGVQCESEPSVVSGMINDAVESEAEPSNTRVQSESEPSSVSEMKIDAMESEVEPSNTTVLSETKPVVSEMKNDAVEREVEPSNSALQSQSEHSVMSEMKSDALESEVEPSNRALQGESEPSVVSEMKSDAVESEVEPSNCALQSESEPSAVSEVKSDAVESEVESSNSALQGESEPSVVSEIKSDAVESEIEPSNSALQSERESSVVSEMKRDAVESETEPSNSALQSESEPSVVSEMKSDAVESEVEHSNSALQSESEPSVVPEMKDNAGEFEAELSNGTLQSEGEPSFDVSEMKTNVVEREADLSNGTVQSEAEPSTDVVENEAEPSNGMLQSEGEPSVDVSETTGNAVESEAEPSNGTLQSEREPSVDVSEMKTRAVESQVELSVEGKGSNHGDENSRHATDALDGQNMGAEVVKRPFYYFIKVPRYDDDGNIKDQIKNALHQVDEKTKIRDAVRAENQTLKASCKDCGQEVRAAISAERAARELLKSKRQEMDSVQSTVNRLNNAISVGDIDGKIRNMEHMIQHETLPLNEEKQLIRQIKQLKQNREELSSNMKKQDQSQQSLDDKDSIEEHFKHLQLLKKEMEALRNNVLKAETATKTARKKYDDECKKLNELLARFKAADDIRQEAYAKLQALKKQLHEKSKYFWEYRNASNKGQELAAEGRKEELQCFCIDQVERIMELWNKNDEFRRDYVRCNTRSTLRRLQTLDGRSLGPDEEPPIIPNVITERAFKISSVVSQLTMEQEKKSTSTESVITKDEPISNVAIQRTEKSQTTKAKKPTKPAPLEKSVARWGDESDEDKKEVPVRTKEEEELILKAEQARKEEEAVKLKEKRRIEEIEKAKEALQRKKRNAEKAQQRAALKAQKEAEQKEKEREKRARKKERRKAASADTAENTEQEPATSSETLTSVEECDQIEKPAEVTKKPQKLSQFTRQTKAKSLPPALRNRGKRRIQPWMWVLIAVLVVVALFYMGNSSSLKSSLEGFGF